MSELIDGTLPHPDLVTAICIRHRPSDEPLFARSRAPVFCNVSGTDGAASVAVVTLQTGHHAICDREDFDRLVAAGVSTNWLLNAGSKGFFFVKVNSRHVPGRLVTVSRLIMDAGAGQVVRLKNGNPLDLGRSNLVLEAGPAKREFTRRPAVPRAKASTPFEHHGITVTPAAFGATTREAQETLAAAERFLGLSMDLRIVPHSATTFRVALSDGQLARDPITWSDVQALARGEEPRLNG